MARLFIGKHKVSSVRIVRSSSGDAGHGCFLAVEATFGNDDVQALGAVHLGAETTVIDDDTVRRGYVTDAEHLGGATLRISICIPFPTTSAAPSVP